MNQGPGRYSLIDKGDEAIPGDVHDALKTDATGATPVLFGCHNDDGLRFRFAPLAHEKLTDEQRFDRAAQFVARHPAEEFHTAAVISHAKIGVYAARGLIGTGRSGSTKDNAPNLPEKPSSRQCSRA